MEGIINSLRVSIKRLEAELQLYEVLTEALASRFSSDPQALQEYASRARRATYSTTIVGCYGLIEQTIDSVLISVAVAYGRIYDQYGELPDTVRKNHRELILTCLRDGDKARTRRKVIESPAIQALGRKLEESAHLISDVFTLSTANYRLPYVELLFNRLGIDIGKGLGNNEPVNAMAKAGFANYESFIEELVQRRNDLAHSYGDDNLIGPGQLAAYVEIVSSYLLSISRVSNHALLKLLIDKQLAPIGRVVRTWSGRVGIRLTKGSIKVGDRLLLMKDEWSTSHMVTDIYSEEKSLDEAVFIDKELDVSAQVAGVPTNAENALAYVISTEWKDLWPGELKL